MLNVWIMIPGLLMWAVWMIIIASDSERALKKIKNLEESMYELNLRLSYLQDSLETPKE